MTSIPFDNIPRLPTAEQFSTSFTLTAQQAPLCYQAAISLVSVPGLLAADDQAHTCQREREEKVKRLSADSHQGLLQAGL